MLALDIPNFLPNELFGMGWFRPAGRLIWSTVLLVLIVGAIVAVAKRPKPAEPSTWAQSMTGAVIVFATMMLAYGTIPHEWLNFANGYLKWDAAHYVIRSDQWFLNITITKAVVTDVVASLLYVVFLGGNIALFSMWQKRKPAEAPAETESTPSRTSAFGRPVTTKA